MTTQSIASKKTIQLIGLLLLFRIIAGMSGLFLEGVSSGLQEVAKHIQSIKISIVLDLITYTVSVLTAILLFPILKKYNYKLALWFLVFSTIGFANMVQGNVNVYAITRLSQDFTSNPEINESWCQAMALSREYDSKMTHFLSLIIHSLGAFSFYLVLLRQKLIPRFISLFALVAGVLVIINTFLLIFDIKSSMLVFLPNFVAQILLGIWLAYKGFNTEHYLDNNDA